MIKKIFGRASNHLDLYESLALQKALAEEASAFIKQIETGDFNASISEKLSETTLGQSLISIKDHLGKLAIEEQQRNWHNVGLARFADILRNKNSADLNHLAGEILTELVKYVQANQGALFIIENNEGEEFLEMVACYAYERRKYINKKINIGDGLVGQCVLERDMIYLKQTPPDYVHITSGLGHATPREILITPLIINDAVFGVLELASFTTFHDYKRDFINRLSENIAATIKNVKEGERVRNLLNASQQQTEELRAQEEEMRQNMEELQATQEEMQRKGDELSRAAAEMKSILTGINSSMATIEFSPDGTVITANDNFLKSMKYTLEQVVGHHHRKFVPKEFLASEDYKQFWTRLASGQSLSGIFKRIDSEGKVVWLNAIYNPILDAKGNVIKVMKFATNITTQQEQVAESKGILEGINATMATIEFSPDGIVLNANDNFINTMGCKLSEIRGKHHRMFVLEEEANSESYKQFWLRLAKGEAQSGIFKRRSMRGDTIWLNAIYNPIYNAAGEVVKIMKFASDITEQQSMLAELNKN